MISARAFLYSMLACSLTFPSKLKAEFSEPTWWRDPARPVIDPAAVPNNKGVASVGQAKWMVKNALSALKQAAPSIGAAVEAQLIGAGKPLSTLDAPQPPSAIWLDQQKAPLTVGQLKALVAPFYQGLHDAVPTWLEGELTTNGTKDSEDPNNFFPWTSNASDDLNGAVATIGQLKAVFALRFETITLEAPDVDNDGLPDAWENTHFSSLAYDGYSDPDEDGYTNFEELGLGSNPNVADLPFTDSDEDGMPDAFEMNFGLSSTIDDSLEDLDGDGIPNIFEYKNGASPLDDNKKPAYHHTVDWRSGSQSPSDKVHSTIQEALDVTSHAPWDDVNNMPGPSPRPYQMILVKAGRYRENLYMAGKPTLLVGEWSQTDGPAIISGKNMGATLYLESKSVVANFIITHDPGLNGSGVEVQYWEMEPNEPVTLTRRRLHNCIIRGNNEEYGAGGIYSARAHLTLDHCTIFSNSGDENSAGLIQSEGTLVLRNSIVWGNNSTQASSASTQLRVANGGSLVTLATSPNIIGDSNSSAPPGWIDQTDPRLTPAGWLKSNSPAINAGGPISSSPIRRDIQNELRDSTFAPDIGADEYRDGNSTSDGDGIPDWAEGPDDGDGLSALDEYELHGTDPRHADSDGDGLDDGDEIANGLNPIIDEDRDLDGMSDAWEFVHGLNWNSDDGLDDKDGDRIPNIFEFKHGTSPAIYEDHPDMTFEVNPATGGDEPNDNVFSTIEDALDAAASRDLDNDGFADPFPIILVRGGVYAEAMEIPQIPVLLLAELGGASGPVEIRTAENASAMVINSRVVVDGFIVTHQNGFTGTGVEINSSWNDNSQRRRLINCIIRNNTFIIGGGITVSDSHLDLIHCTVMGNSSTLFYPGIRLNSATLELKNSVVAKNIGSSTTWNNRQIDASSDSEIKTSALSPSFIGDSSTSDTLGWIVVRDPGLTSDGLIIDAYTPVVDSGGLIPSTLVRYDLQGQIRSGDNNPDIGADEFNPLYGESNPPAGGSGYSTIDTDGDGIPDQWEIAHGLDPLVANGQEDLQSYLDDQHMIYPELKVYTNLQ